MLYLLDVWDECTKGLFSFNENPYHQCPPNNFSALISGFVFPSGVLKLLVISLPCNWDQVSLPSISFLVHSDNHQCPVLYYTVVSLSKEFAFSRFAMRLVSPRLPVFCHIRLPRFGSRKRRHFLSWLSSSLRNIVELPFLVSKIFAYDPADQFEQTRSRPGIKLF